MLLTVRCGRGTLDVVTWSPHTEVMGATIAAAINQAVLRMLLAVCRRLANKGIVAWSPCAGDMRATLPADVDHDILSMLLAVRRCLESLYIEG